MSKLQRHAHVVFRVIRAEWDQPLDSDYSKASGGRWNAPGSFGVLYTCCSEDVARAIAFDLFKFTGLELDDLRPAKRPELIEIEWEGNVIDLTSSESLQESGFDDVYPWGTAEERTRAFGEKCAQDGTEGVLCRSASLARGGFANWIGRHESWSELAIFVEACISAPRLLRRARTQDWLVVGSEPPQDAREEASQPS